MTSQPARWFNSLLRMVGPAALGLFAVMANAEPPSTQPASLRHARERALAGDYSEAIKLYEELGADPKKALSAAIGRSDVDLQIGDYQKGIERLRALEEKGRGSADWHAAIASLHNAIGQFDQAIEQNQNAVKIDLRHLRAHWQLGQLYETIGKTKEALDAYRVFEQIMTGAELPATAEDLTYLGQGFLRYSTLTRNRDIVQRTKHVLTEVYQEAFEFIDAGYWPARLASAELLLAKHNLREAKADFEAVLEQNPKAAEANVGLGLVALEDWDFDVAEKNASAALKVNPASVSARVLLASTRMTERRFKEAAAIAEEALRTNPNSIDALSLLAAAHLRAGDEAASKRDGERVESICPHSAVLHHTLGLWLSAGRQYPEAEAHFKAAIEIVPSWVDPRTALGQLYMETGEEHLARRTLEASFALDSFDAHTHNVLHLLDGLDHFARLETKHFIIKYDAAQDAVIAPYLADVLEQVYPDVCGDFATELKDRTIIEVFPDHMGFSVRITGRPFIATVGACCGRVIAMQAPRGGPPFGPFNWATVLRHEFTHTVTLAATKNRIPHWMTEGLAVHEQPIPQSWAAKQLLNAAVREDRLFTLDSIDWGFMRPKRPDDRSLAYAQGEWMVQYAIERFGHPIVRKLLDAFRDGKDQPTALKEVLGISTRQFDSEFREWARKQAAAWGLRHTPEEKVDDVKALVEKKPDDARLIARLAMAQWHEGEADGAFQSAEKALAMDKNQTMALEVLTGLYIGELARLKERNNRRDKARLIEPYLRRLLKLDPDHPAATLNLGIVKQTLGEFPRAIELFIRYQSRFPDDPESYRHLAGIYLLQERRTEGLQQLEQLARLSEDEAAVCKQIGDFHDDAKEPQVAARWYQRAIDVNPYDPAVHRAYREVLLLLGRNDAAKKEADALKLLEAAENQ